MSEQVKFNFTRYDQGPTLLMAIKAMIQVAAESIAVEMKLACDWSSVDGYTDLVVSVPRTRMMKFINKMGEVGIPVELCGTVDCDNQRTGDLLASHGFQPEVFYPDEIADE